MDAVPQRHLRRVTLLYLCCMTLAFVCGSLCISEMLRQRILYHYNMYLAQNMGLVIAMLEWMPSMEALDAVDLASLLQRTSYDVVVRRVGSASDVEATGVEARAAATANAGAAAAPRYSGLGMRVSHTFPGNVTAYLPGLSATLHVRETTAPYAIIGQQANVTVASFMFIVIMIAAVRIGVHAAQCIAATRRARTHAWVRWAAYLVAGVALVSPMFVCVAFVASMTRMQYEVFLRTWKVELGRAVVLLTQVYDTIARAYIGTLPTTLLVPTLEMVHEVYAGPQARYGVFLFNITGNALYPASVKTDLLTDPTEFAKLQQYLLNSGVGGGARGVSVAEQLPGTEVIVASAPLTQLDGCGLLLVFRLKRSLPQFMDDSLRLPTQFIFIAVAVLCVAALLFFPYTTLGTVGGRVTWAGPWAWRTSRYWPLQKLVHASVLVALFVFVVAVLSSRLSEFGANMAYVHTTMREQLEVSITAADAGAGLLNNYREVLSNSGWNTSMLRRYGRAIDSAKLADVSRFYQGVFMIESQLHTNNGSVFYAARAMPKEQLPLLANDDDLSEFVSENQYQTDTAQLTLDIALWDLEALKSWVLNNVTHIQSGNTDLAEDMLILATSLGDQKGYDLANRSLTRALHGAAPFAALADKILKMNVTWKDIEALYADPWGRQVVKYEDEAFASAYSGAQSTMFYANSYNVTATTLLAPVLVAIVLLGADLLGDFAVVAFVFGRLRHADAQRRRRRRAAAAALMSATIGRGGGDRPTTPASGRNASAQRLALQEQRDGDDDGDDCEKVPSNDFTAPSQHLRVHHGVLRSAVCHGALATTLLTVLCAATFVFCDLEAVRLMAPMTRQDTYVDSVAHSVDENMQAVAITAYAAAAWMRAMLSRHRDDFLTAAQASNNLSRLKNVRWLDDYEQRRSFGARAHRGDDADDEAAAGAVSSNVLNTQQRIDRAAHVPRMAPQLSSSMTKEQVRTRRDDDDDADHNQDEGKANGGQDTTSKGTFVGDGGEVFNDADVSSDVASILLTVTTYASTLLDAGQVDVYVDFQDEIKTFFDLVNLDKLYKCMSTADMTALVGIMTKYMLGTMYATITNSSDAIYAAFGNFVDDTNPCMVPEAAMSHMIYAAALLRRTRFDADVVSMAKQLSERAQRSVAKRTAMVRSYVDQSTATTHVDTTTMVWAAILMSWLCTLLVYAVYRAATRAHEAIYYS